MCFGFRSIGCSCSGDHTRVFQAPAGVPASLRCGSDLLNQTHVDSLSVVSLVNSMPLFFTALVMSSLQIVITACNVLPLDPVSLDYCSSSWGAKHLEVMVHVGCLCAGLCLQLTRSWMFHLGLMDFQALLVLADLAVDAFWAHSGQVFIPCLYGLKFCRRCRFSGYLLLSTIHCLCSCHHSVLGCHPACS